MIGYLALGVMTGFIAATIYLAWSTCRCSAQADQRAAELAARRDGAFLRRD